MPNDDGLDCEINYLNIDETLLERKRKLAQHHFIFGLFFSLYVLCLIFYFSLPTFQVKNMSVDGLVYLSKENYFNLSGISENTSFLFFDANEAYQNAATRAPFLILDGKAYNNPLVSKTEILENRPLFKHDDVQYFIYETFDELQPKIASLSTLLSENYLQTIEQLSLPLLHFNSDNLSSNLDDFKQAMIFINPIYLTQIEHIQFSLNENSSEQISSKVFAIIKSPDTEDRIGLHFETNQIKYIFSENNYENILTLINEKINTSDGSAKKSEYFFDDTQAGVDCYQFDLELIEDEISVVWRAL